MAENLHIPPFVNYTCQVCGWCCRQYDITFSQADYDRLSKQDWGALEPSLAGKEWVAPLRERGSPDKYRLRYTEEGACVFLSDKKCLMHKHVGELGKSLGCCVFPFTFAATPSGTYVGCRFSCKAVAYGIGEPAVRGEESIRKQLELCRKAGLVPQYPEMVAFDGKVTLPWKDYLLFEETLLRVILRDDLSIERRLLLAHKFLDILRQARLERVRGPKFRELMQILEEGLWQEAEAEELPGRPGGLWRVMFRQFCFLFQRRQGGQYREKGFWARLATRLRTFRAGIKMARGKGELQMPGIEGTIRLEELENMTVPPMDEAQELLLSRFLAGKIFGKQYFGKLMFGYTLRAGLEFLLLSAGAVMWYARVYAYARGSKVVETEDITEAIRYVDMCYGYSRAVKSGMEKLRVRILSHEDRAIRATLAQFAAKGSGALVSQSS